MPKDSNDNPRDQPSGGRKPGGDLIGSDPVLRRKLPNRGTTIEDTTRPVRKKDGTDDTTRRD